MQDSSPHSSIVLRWTAAGPTDVDILGYHLNRNGGAHDDPARATSTDESWRDPSRGVSRAARHDAEQLADHLGCDVKVVNRIVNGRTSVSAGMALKLGAALRTTPEFWLNAQKAVEIYRASRAGVELPKPILRAS